MNTNILRRISSLPVIREVLGAAGGCAIALVLYEVFEFARGIFGGHLPDVVTPVHAAASLVVAQGTASIALPLTLALAGGCAFLHRRLMSEID